MCFLLTLHWAHVKDDQASARESHMCLSLNPNSYSHTSELCVRQILKNLLKSPSNKAYFPYSLELLSQVTLKVKKNITITQKPRCQFNQSINHSMYYLCLESRTLLLDLMWSWLESSTSCQIKAPACVHNWQSHNLFTQFPPRKKLPVWLKGLGTMAVWTIKSISDCM